MMPLHLNTSTPKGNILYLYLFLLSMLLARNEYPKLAGLELCSLIRYVTISLWEDRSSSSECQNHLYCTFITVFLESSVIAKSFIVITQCLTQHSTNNEITGALLIVTSVLLKMQSKYIRHFIRHLIILQFKCLLIGFNPV